MTETALIFLCQVSLHYQSGQKVVQYEKGKNRRFNQHAQYLSLNATFDADLQILSSKALGALKSIIKHKSKI